MAGADRPGPSAEGLKLPRTPRCASQKSTPAPMSRHLPHRAAPPLTVRAEPHLSGASGPFRCPGLDLDPLEVGERAYPELPVTGARFFNRGAAGLVVLVPSIVLGCWRKAGH